MEGATDRLLQKVSRKNEPLEAYRTTKAFKKFMALFSDAITKQLEWAAEHIKDIPHIEAENIIESQLVDNITQWAQDMPLIASFITVDEVSEYYIDTFNYTCRTALTRLGFVVKANTASFDLTNKDYIAALKNNANYLLSTKSKIDNTTRDRVIKLVQDAKLVDNATIDEISDIISSEVESISSVRSFMIANTETANAMGTANLAFMKESDFQNKVWVIAGPHDLEDECDDNADDGPIPIDEPFSSGDDHEPAHINCECYTEPELSDGPEAALQDFNIWDGS